MDEDRFDLSNSPEYSKILKDGVFAFDSCESGKSDIFILRYHPT